jgi:L,D-transpeptidase ErfK/SrfK
MKLSIEAHRLVPAGYAEGIVVNVPQLRLFAAAVDGSAIAVPSAVGRPSWPTPAGSFNVVQKEIDPTWDVPPSIQEEMRRLGKPPVARVPPGPANPLGAYWIGLSLPNIGIHGTNAPTSVPGFTTHGCIRVGPEAIALLFDSVAVGTPGEIIYEPVLLAKHDGRLFVEAHRDVYGRRPDALETLAAAADELGARERIDWGSVKDVVRRREGIAIDVTLK